MKTTKYRQKKIQLEKKRREKEIWTQLKKSLTKREWFELHFLYLFNRGVRAKINAKINVPEIDNSYEIDLKYYERIEKPKENNVKKKPSREPKKKESRISFKKFGIAFAILIFSGGGIWFFFKGVPVSNIQVTGSSIYSAEYLIEKSGLSEDKDNWFLANFKKSEENIYESLYYIDEVNVKRKFFGKTEINVSPQKPIAIIYIKGEPCYLSKSGRILPEEPYLAAYEEIDVVSIDEGNDIATDNLSYLATAPESDDLLKFIGYDFKSIELGEMITYEQGKSEADQKFAVIEIIKILENISDSIDYEDFSDKIKEIDISNFFDIKLKYVSEDSGITLCVGKFSDVLEKLEISNKIISEYHSKESGILKISDSDYVVFTPS